MAKKIEVILKEALGLLRGEALPKSIWLPYGKEGKRRLHLSRLVFVRPKYNSLTKSEVQLEGEYLMDWHCDFSSMASHLEPYLANLEGGKGFLFLANGHSPSPEQPSKSHLERKWMINNPYLVAYSPVKNSRHKQLDAEWINTNGLREKQSFLMTHHYWSKEGGREWVEGCV